MSDDRDLTPDQVLAVAEAAGVTRDELHFDPVAGLSVTPEGARKIAALAPDNKAKLDFLAWLQSLPTKR